MAVAVILSAHADESSQAWPSLETIAGLLGMHQNRVTEAIHVLMEANVVSRQRRARKSSLYRVHYRPPEVGESPNGGESPDLGVDDPPNPGVHDPPDPRRSNRPTNTPPKKTTTTSVNSSSKPTEGNAIDASLRLEIIEALRPFKENAEVEATTLARQHDEETLRLIVGWLKTDAAAKMQNPIGFAVSRARTKETPPVQTKFGLRTIASGVCTYCGAKNAGFVPAPGFLVCVDCEEQDRARRRYCGMACAYMHFPWEPCGVNPLANHP